MLYCGNSGRISSSITVSIGLTFMLLAAFVPIHAAVAEPDFTDPTLIAAKPYPHVSGEILVRFVEDASAGQRREVLAQRELTEIGSFPAINTRLVKTNQEDLVAVVAELNHDPRVEYAEPNFLIRLESAPADPRYPIQWSLNNTGQIVSGRRGIEDSDIDAPEAWDIITGRPEVVVAVIDSGVDFSHPDLGGSNQDSQVMWTNPGEACPGCSDDGLDNDGNGYIDDWRGWDFVNLDDDPQDDNGHGTHVAGIIAAQADNNEGGAGVAHGTTIMALKAFTESGGGSTGATVAAILYAVDMGASIINSSCGNVSPSRTLKEAIEYAGDQGVLYVAAGGNDGLDTDLVGHFPSALDLNNLISVGATNSRDELAVFSNFGLKTVDIGAPGEDIFAPWLASEAGNRYLIASDTSMAAPHVTGVAALIKAQFPNATPLGIKSLIFNAADRNASLEGRVSTGGRLNAVNAVSCRNEPQVWIDRPVPGFAAVPGEPVEVRVLASNCAVPDGLRVTASSAGELFELVNQGGGLYTGTMIPGAPGPVTISAQAQLGSRIDRQRVSGEAVLNYRFENDMFNWLDPDDENEIVFAGARLPVGGPAPVPLHLLRSDISGDDDQRERPDWVRTYPRNEPVQRVDSQHPCTQRLHCRLLGQP